MSLNLGQVSSLLGGASNNKQANPYDLLTGAKTVNEALVNSYISSTNLSAQQSKQSDALSNLEEYVKKNISGTDADKLLNSIESVRNLLKNQDSSSDLDPALSLLASSPFARQSGSIIDQLF